MMDDGRKMKELRWILAGQARGTLEQRGICGTKGYLKAKG